jgi:hypothetical protein
VAVYRPKTVEEEQERIRPLSRASTPESDLDTPADEKKAADFALRGLNFFSDGGVLGLISWHSVFVM